MPTMNNFNDQVMAELENDSFKTLKAHPGNILDKVAYAVNRVFVSKDPAEDPQEVKLAVMVDMLNKLAQALQDQDNPLGFSFDMDEKGQYYTGSYSFKVNTEFAKTSLIPEAMAERSALNRVKRAAKALASS